MPEPVLGSLTPELKDRIDQMTQSEMARLWRHAPVGSPYFVGATGAYFEKRFKELGGFTPAISKQVG